MEIYKNVNIKDINTISGSSHMYSFCYYQLAVYNVVALPLKGKSLAFLLMSRKTSYATRTEQLEKINNIFDMVTLRGLESHDLDSNQNMMT